MARARGWIALGSWLVAGMWGCGIRVEVEVDVGGSEGDEERTHASAQAAKCNGCPFSVPVTTYNYAPPHAFPGPCSGPSDPSQAAFDGALAELTAQCAVYCAQSEPACAAFASLEGTFCMDRDIGHRWGAICHCG